MKHLVSTISFLIFFWVCSYGQIVNVPAEQPTIQAGIDATANGDTVLVAEGTYFENINFKGKAITVTSHYIIDNRLRHIKKTIINGSKPDDPNSASVVSFTSGENINSVLCGFTITGGEGTVEFAPGLPPIRSGGGIFCSASGAKIIHNIITKNSVESEGWAFGGGFYYGPPFIPSYVVLEENIITKNSVSGVSRALGGGIEVGCSAKINKNVIDNNTTYSVAGHAAGGGLSVESWDPAVIPPNKVIISKNVIVKNKALQSDEATYWLGGIGGGISLLFSKGIVTNNIIKYNEVSAANTSSAPGILFDFPPDEVYFRNNIVSHNYFSGSGICYGGGFAIWDGSPTIENNLFDKNKASLGGGGWIGDIFSNAKIVNNTITNNTAILKGGAIYTKSATPKVMNSILWNNNAPEGNEIFVESGTIDVSYSDIKGGWFGVDNINSNPKLVTSVKLLRKSSPCIDAGNPANMYNDPEHPLHTGIAKFPSRGLVKNDMGAYGGPHAKSWCNFLGKTIDEINEEIETENVVLNKIEIDNYPNPFNPSTTIMYSIPNTSTENFQSVHLIVYDILGREVTTLVNENKKPGSYKIVWNANNQPSGVYFYQLTVGEFVESKKMILLR